jgi:hypothetical protein
MTVTLEENFKEFISSQLSVKLSHLRPETRLNHDLGVDGDDGLEFMAAFSNRFCVNLSAFDASKHFGPEGSGNPFTYLW